MAKYTFTLREMVQMYDRETVEGWFKDYDFSHYLTPEQIEVIEDTGIFSKDYLASMIVDHFYLRESGLETPGLFIVRAKVKMRELMDRYAPLIYSAAIKIDPLVNVDYTEELARTTSGTTSSSSSSSDLGINSDTPQGQINKQQILQGKYATSTVGNEGTSEGSGESSGEENYTKHVKGNSGVSATAQALIRQYRDIIEPINYDIIEEIEDLFMGIY